jgi:transcriptional regulator
MHPTPTFHWEDRAAMLAFVGERAFATIAAPLDGSIAFAQAPVIVDGDTLLLHLSRANRLARALPLRASVLVGGADTYVSPDWYGEHDQVPTWNYVSVELEGELRAVEDDRLVEILRRESAAFEARLAGKPPWTLDKMTPQVLAAKLKGIVGATLAVETIRGTRKLSQNKTESARAGVIEALAASPHEADRTIARLMRS